MGTFSDMFKTSLMLAMIWMEHAGAARVKASLKGSDFECPSQCLECCDSTSFGGLFGKTFKCILRNPEEVPQEEGRECQTPKERNTYGEHHYKTYCKYLGSEERATEKQCSSNFECCCSEDQNWNENRCFAGAQEGKREELANHNNKVELFVMSGSTNVSADAQLFTNMGPCKREGNTHHVYDATSVPRPSDKPGSTSRRTSGCCLKTKETRVKHHWTTAGARMGNPPRMHRTPHSKDVKYTTCIQHERLHHCSNDGGITASGEFKYKRVPGPGVQGTCLGNEQSTMVGEVGQKLHKQPFEKYHCPKDMFAGSWCACDMAADPAQKGCSALHTWRA